MIVLFTGGARSGKSALAEKRAVDLNRGAFPLTYVATTYLAAPGTSGFDPGMRKRVETHRIRRGSEWQTLEIFSGDSRPWGAGRDTVTLDWVLDLLQDLEGTALLDSLGTLVAALEGFRGNFEKFSRGLARIFGGDRNLVVVTDEVGMSVHPETPSGAAFRDSLGEANQNLSKVASEVWAVNVGIPSLLKPNDLPVWAEQ